MKTTKKRPTIPRVESRKPSSAAHAARLLLVLLMLALPAPVRAEDYTYTTNNGAITLTKYIGSGGDVIIPDAINGLPLTIIGNTAFAFSSLTSVTIPVSVTNIGCQAFGRCASLANVTIGDGVTSIGAGAFKFCTGLTTVTLPDTVTTIGEEAFHACTSLSSIVIPGGVSTIESWTFTFANDLTAVYFRGNAPNLGTDVFLADNPATVYYLPGTTGWEASFGGRPTALWLPQVQTSDVSFGVRTNQFGFNIAWASGQTVVVEACTNLANPIWASLRTNILTGGSFYFSDPDWTNHSGRFYRLRSP